MGGGGGGGYYAGNNGYGTTGSGGSSFISGYAGVNAITSSTDRTHTNNTLHYSDKYFIDGEMQVGINVGDGKAKITYIGPTYEKTSTKFDYVRYIKDCINGNSSNEYNHWVELQALSNGVNVAYGKNITSTTEPGTGNTSWADITTLVDGEIAPAGYIRLTSGEQCLTVDLGTIYTLDEIAVWHLGIFSDGRSYNNHSLYVSSDNTNWTTLIDNVSGVVETSNGIRVSAYD